MKYIFCLLISLCIIGCVTNENKTIGTTTHSYKYQISFFPSTYYTYQYYTNDYDFMSGGNKLGFYDIKNGHYVIINGNYQITTVQE